MKDLRYDVISEPVNSELNYLPIEHVMFIIALPNLLCFNTLVLFYVLYLANLPKNISVEDEMCIGKW